MDCSNRLKECYNKLKVVEKMNIRLRLTPQTIIKGLFVLLMLLEINSVFFKAVSYNFYISELACICVVILMLTNKIKLGSNILIFFIVYMFLALLYMLNAVGSDSFVSYSVKFLIFLPVMVLYFFTDINRGIEFTKYFADMVVMLAFLSLCCYFLSYFTNPLNYFTVDWGGIRDYGNYLFFFDGQQQEIAGNYYARNIGIFCEAPMYAFVLSLALCAKLFFYKDMKKQSIIILCITILTTFSMTGIAVMVGLLLLRYYIGDLRLERNEDVYRRRRKSSLKRVLSIIGLIAVVIIVYNIFYFKTSTGMSYMIRLDDYSAAFKAWLSNPIWGVGYNNFEAIRTNMADWRLSWYTNQGFSNAISHILATMGAFGVLTYVLGFWGGIRESIRRNIPYMAIQLIVLIALLCVTVVPMQLFVLQYIAYGLSIFFVSSRSL